MSTDQKALVIISYYDRRPIDNILALIPSLLDHPAGGEFDICIVVNRTKEEKLDLPERYSQIPIEYRHNLGMNIGAWDHGWRTHKGYRDYLFLQDECYVIRSNWLTAYRVANERPHVGIVGESVSKLWERSWSELRRLLANNELPEHSVGGKPVNRVDYYLNFLRENNVDPQEKGTHLRSVVWFLSGTVLDQIDGFLIGRNYGECIGAEIATSKKVEALGLRIAQANEQEEFFYIRHLEYNQDSPGSPYTHDVKYVDYASVRRLIDSKDQKLWPLLRLKMQKLLKRSTSK